MADKRINELEEALSFTASDLFVIQQANTAKKLSGRTMTDFLLELANGHGGISGITKTGSAGTNPIVDTYTITFADLTTATFTVTNGVKGDTGATGPQGPKGDNITITSTSVMYQAWTSGSTYPTGTWQDDPPAVSPGSFLWTRTIINYSDGSHTVAYSVARYGIDGAGSVSSVCNVSPDGTGNVELTASDVGALPASYQAPVTSVNTKSGAVDLNANDVGAVRGLTVSGTKSAAGWYRVTKYAASSANDAAGYSGVIVRLDICRNYSGAANETHTIDLHLVYGNIKFIGEKSVSNVLGIDKVRYTTDGANGYIDIHYSLSNSNNVSASFSVLSALEEQAKFSIQTLQSVNDAPSGETIVAVYSLAANTDAYEDAAKDSSFSASTFSLEAYRRGDVLVYYYNIRVPALSAGVETTMCTFTNIKPPEKRNLTIIGQDGGAYMLQFYTDGHVTIYAGSSTAAQMIRGDMVTISH